MNVIDAKDGLPKPIVQEDVLGFFLNGEMHVIYYAGSGQWSRRMDEEVWSAPDYWTRLPKEPVQPK